MTTKSGKIIFWQNLADDSAHINITVSRTINKIKIFLDFTHHLPVDSAYTLGIKFFVEIVLSCTISEVKYFFEFNTEN